MTKAWKAAFAVAGSKVVISAGAYKLGLVTLLGPWKGAIEFNLQGTLQAPSDVASFNGKDGWVILNVSTVSLCQVVEFLIAKDNKHDKKNECDKDKNCNVLPIVRFQT